MAFSTIDKVREAELSAQKAGVEAQRSAPQSAAETQREADDVVAAALEEAELDVAHREAKARANAEEIMVTSRNSSLLEVEKLKRSCEKKQSEVNRRVLEIIV